MHHLSVDFGGRFGPRVPWRKSWREYSIRLSKTHIWSTYIHTNPFTRQQNAGNGCRLVLRKIPLDMQEESWGMQIIAVLEAQLKINLVVQTKQLKIRIALCSWSSWIKNSRMVSIGTIPPTRIPVTTRILPFCDDCILGPGGDRIDRYGRYQPVRFFSFSRPSRKLKKFLKRTFGCGVGGEVGWRMHQ